MIKGVITCSCGQLFGYETAQEIVACPACALTFRAADYATVEPEPTEEVIYGTDI